MEGASLEIYLYLTCVPSGRNQKGLSAIANFEAPKNSDFGTLILRLVNHWQQSLLASLKIYLHLTRVPSGRNQKGLSAIVNFEAPKNSNSGIPISRLVNHWPQRQCSCQLLPAST